MKVGITRFPGTNCDYDVWGMVEAKGHKPEWMWHQDQYDAKNYDMVIVPGGFSYGDYLRCGALSARSPVMKTVREIAERGTPVLGICNGFQILCETHILPGVLLRNRGQKFIDQWIDLEVVNENPHFGKSLKAKTAFKLPIAHGEGQFFAHEDEMKKMEDNGQVWLRYKNNPNGSLKDIAGVMNAKKNVMALMPHPERALYDWMGGKDGWSFL